LYWNEKIMLLFGEHAFVCGGDTTEVAQLSKFGDEL
jgi:hypothetical protein